MKKLRLDISGNFNEVDNICVVLVSCDLNLTITWTNNLPRSKETRHINLVLSQMFFKLTKFIDLSNINIYNTSHCR
jgi:hypothetical protein